MVLFTSSLSYLNLTLNLVLLVLLSRNFARQYRLLFLYALVHLVTTVVEVFVKTVDGLASTTYANFYWADEVLVDLLLFLMVISFIRRAAAGRPTGAAANKIMVAVLLAAVLLPIVFGRVPLVPGRIPVRLSGRWFTSASQVLNFGGAIMNLVLWGNLIGTKQRDPKMLTVCAGLGIAITGEAIRYGLLALLPGFPAADVFGWLTSLAGWAIWCWAFRPSSSSAVPPAATSSGY